MTHVIIAMDSPLLRILITNHLKLIDKGNYKVVLDTDKLQSIQSKIIEGIKDKAIVVFTDTSTISKTPKAKDEINRLKSISENLRFLLLSAEKQELIASEIIDSGVKGCVNCRTSPFEYPRLFEALAKGEVGINYDALIDYYQSKSGTKISLNQNERIFLHHFSNGLGIKEIVPEMNQSLRNIQRLKSNLLSKLNLNSDGMLIRFGIINGYDQKL
jgi:DNA-binding NarL/FixJ family response regulator